MKYIFIHGLGQDSSSWSQTVSHMNLENKIVCPDLYSFLKRDKASIQAYISTFHGIVMKYQSP